MTRSEALYLRAMAVGRQRILEIGAWLGFSTVLMAQAADGVVVSVDWHRGDWAHEEGTRTLPQFIDHLDAFGVLDKVIPVIQKSEVAVPLLAGGFDFSFVDGNHDVEHVERDAMLAITSVVEGATIVFHDYDEFGVREGLAAAGLPEEKLSLGPGSMATVIV